MIRILFVCHGNICRSPMGEFRMKDLVERAGRGAEFLIASAATSREEIGNPVYPPARRKLAEHGIGCEGHAARQLVRADAAETRRGKCGCCWILPTVRGMWQTRGIPGISTLPGGMWTRAAGRCWQVYKRIFGKDAALRRLFAIS